MNAFNIFPTWHSITFSLHQWLNGNSVQYFKHKRSRALLSTLCKYCIYLSQHHQIKTTFVCLWHLTPVIMNPAVQHNMQHSTAYEQTLLTTMLCWPWCQFKLEVCFACGLCPSIPSPFICLPKCLLNEDHHIYLHHLSKQLNPGFYYSLCKRTCKTFPLPFPFSL